MYLHFVLSLMPQLVSSLGVYLCASANWKPLMYSYRCASDYRNHRNTKRIAKQPEETKGKKKEQDRDTMARWRTRGRIEQIDSSPCDLHPRQHNQKYAFIVFVACQASAPRHGKGPPTLSIYIIQQRIPYTHVVHTCASAYPDNYLSVSSGDAHKSSDQLQSCYPSGATHDDLQTGSINRMTGLVWPLKMSWLLLAEMNLLRTLMQMAVSMKY